MTANHTHLAEMVPARYKGARRRFPVGDFEKVTVQAELMVGTSASVVFTVLRANAPGGEAAAMPSSVTITPAGARSMASAIIDVQGIAELEVYVSTGEAAEAWFNIGVRGQLAANTGNVGHGDIADATFDGPA